MSLPTGTPTEFKVAVVEKKRDLEPKGDMPAKVILKLGLVHGEEKGWADLFADTDQSAWPKPLSNATFILDPPKQEGWNYTAKRPRQGGGYRGGSGRGSSDGSIEAQVAFKGAIELVIAGKAEIPDVASLTSDFAHAIRGAKA